MNKITFNQYKNSVPGVFRRGDPKCPFIAAIPTLTVTNIDGLKGLADCLVHVTDNNTTYYIDDKHRITVTWSGPVEIEDYDYETNPNRLRSQEVWDFKNNRIIFYDAVGNYVVFAGTVDDFNQLKNRPKYAGQPMTGDTNIPDVDAIQAAVSDIDSAIDKVVMTDLYLDANPSTTTVQLDSAKANIKTSATSTENIPLPVASTTQAGVMNSATFEAVGQNAANINALLNGAVAVSGLSATPTQQDLTTAWETETGLASLINRASVFDIDNDKVWTYYTNTATWYSAANTAQVTVSPFTNTSAGTIKGSTNVGQVFAESDGTGSINGWDALNATVDNHTSALFNLAPVATSGSYLDLTNTPTNVSSFTNDAGYLTLNSEDAEIGEEFFSWVATSADAETDRIAHYIPLDLIKYRKIVVEAAWEPNGQPQPTWSIWRFWRSFIDGSEGDPDAINTNQVGAQWAGNTFTSIFRASNEAIAAGVTEHQSVHQHIEIYSAKPGVNYVTFSAKSFGASPLESSSLGGAQLVQGRVVEPVSEIKSLKVPLYYPDEGSWVRAYGYKRLTSN